MCVNYFLFESFRVHRMIAFFFACPSFENVLTFLPSPPPFCTVFFNNTSDPFYDRVEKEFSTFRMHKTTKDINFKILIFGWSSHYSELRLLSALIYDHIFSSLSSSSSTLYTSLSHSFFPGSSTFFFRCGLYRVSLQIHPTKLVLLFCFPGAVFSKVEATIVNGDDMEDVENFSGGNMFQRLKLRSTKRKTKNRQI